MSRVSDSLYGAAIAKPSATGDANANAAAIRAILDALRAAGVVIDDDSGDVA